MEDGVTETAELMEAVGGRHRAGESGRLELGGRVRALPEVVRSCWNFMCRHQKEKQVDEAVGGDGSCRRRRREWRREDVLARE